MLTYAAYYTTVIKFWNFSGNVYNVFLTIYGLFSVADDTALKLNGKTPAQVLIIPADPVVAHDPLMSK